MRTVLIVSDMVTFYGFWIAVFVHGMWCLPFLVEKGPPGPSGLCGFSGIRRLAAFSRAEAEKSEKEPASHGSDGFVGRGHGRAVVDELLLRFGRRRQHDPRWAERWGEMGGSAANDSKLTNAWDGQGVTRG